MSLDPAVRDAFAIAGVVAAGLSLVLLVVVVLLATRLRRLRRDYSVLQAAEGIDGASGTESFVDVVSRKTAEVTALRGQVDRLAGDLSRTRAELSDALRHVSVVRYDAFGDLGGRLSFSAALLDDDGDGLVLSSIHGRTETRMYVKGVKAGTGDATLSPEEEQAVRFARDGSAS